MKKTSYGFQLDWTNKSFEDYRDDLVVIRQDMMTQWRKFFEFNLFKNHDLLLYWIWRLYSQSVRDFSIILKNEDYILQSKSAVQRPQKIFDKQWRFWE